MSASRQPKGQALVEFALLATLVITLLLGIVDFGRAYYTQVQIKNAVGDAGYYATQHPGSSNYTKVKAVITGQLSNLNPPLNANTDISVNCPTGSSTTTIRVAYQYNLLFSWIVPSAHVTLGDETYAPQLKACS